jgi:hypothetical protein
MTVVFEWRGKKPKPPQENGWLGEGGNMAKKKKPFSKNQDLSSFRPIGYPTAPFS